MNHRPAPCPARHRRWLATAAASLLVPLLCTAAVAAEPATGRTDAETVYRQERAACLDGSGPQDRSTCLKEAGAARAEARRRHLDNGESPAQLRANALLRCRPVLDADRAACERMALGEGTRSGSVAGGAVLKQITTVTVGKVAPPAATASR
jgi:hypothetical protein